MNARKQCSWKFGVVIGAFFLLSALVTDSLAYSDNLTSGMMRQAKISEAFRSASGKAINATEVILAGIVVSLFTLPLGFYRITKPELRSSAKWLLGIGVVSVLVVVVAGVALKGYRSEGKRLVCIAHLNILAFAKDQAANELNLSPGAPISMEQILRFTDALTLQCPAGGRYDLGNIGQEPRCSIPSHSLSDF
jgi:hypothetical protein